MAHAADGARHFADACAPVEEALTRQRAAELYARLGEVSEVQLELGRAKTLYATTGATWLSTELAGTSGGWPRSRRAAAGGGATRLPRSPSGCGRSPTSSPAG